MEVTTNYKRDIRNILEIIIEELPNVESYLKKINLYIVKYVETNDPVCMTKMKTKIYNMNTYINNVVYCNTKLFASSKKLRWINNKNEEQIMIMFDFRPDTLGLTTKDSYTQDDLVLYDNMIIQGLKWIDNASKYYTDLYKKVTKKHAT